MIAGFKNFARGLASVIPLFKPHFAEGVMKHLPKNVQSAFTTVETFYKNN
jgi:hypothetical protein